MRPPNQRVAKISAAAPILTRLQDQILERPFGVIVLLWLAAYVVVGLIFWLFYLCPGALTTGDPPRDPRLDEALSFSFITQSTIGYGNVVPQGFAQLFANVQAILGTGLNGLAVGLITFRLLRRRPPLIGPPTASFDAPAGQTPTFWFRYVNTDSKPLVDARVRLFFTTASSSQNYGYDAVGGKIREMELAVIRPLTVMALKEPARRNDISIHDPLSPASLNDGDLSLHPEMFFVGGQIDRRARLLLVIDGAFLATRESFSTEYIFEAADIRCSPFENADNNLLADQPEKRVKGVERLLALHKGPDRDHCVACEDLPGCPFGPHRKTPS